MTGINQVGLVNTGDDRQGARYHRSRVQPLTCKVPDLLGWVVIMWGLRCGQYNFAWSDITVVVLVCGLGCGATIESRDRKTFLHIQICARRVQIYLWHPNPNFVIVYRCISLVVYSRIMLGILLFMIMPTNFDKFVRAGATGACMDCARRSAESIGRCRLVVSTTVGSDSHFILT